MHGRLIVGALGLFVLISGCSSKNSLMKPDCHSCTVEEQEWDEFSWNALVGRWKGSVENFRNGADAKKSRTDKAADLQFVKAPAFLRTFGGTCQNLPEGAVVLNGQLWENGSMTKEYEAFVPAEDGKVAYGRVSVEKVNGKDLCHFRRFGRVMGKNRLNLPTVAFTDSAVTKGRVPASQGNEQEYNVEFLRFATLDKGVKDFQSSGRMPASAREQERPSLILRVFKVSHSTQGDRGTWNGTEEYIYRLWKTQ